MVKARIAAASAFVASHSMTTENTASVMPKANASSRVTLPAGMGRFAVRFITASMSDSHHMLSAPAAPPPTAMKRIAASPTTGCTATGAASSPTSAVNTTSVITRGFRSAKKSRNPASPVCAAAAWLAVFRLASLISVSCQAAHRRTRPAGSFRARPKGRARLTSLGGGHLARARRAGIFLDRPVEPLLIRLFAHDLHGDRHIGMRLPAKLRTLAEIDTFLLGLEPKLRQTPRHRILLHAEGGDRPAMDHVGPGHGHHHGLAHRHDDSSIGGQQELVLAIARLDQLFLDLGRQAIVAPGRRRPDHVAVKGKLVIGVF